MSGLVDAYLRIEVPILGLAWTGESEVRAGEVVRSPEKIRVEVIAPGGGVAAVHAGKVVVVEEGHGVEEVGWGLRVLR